jgi:hypothetical protein
MTRPGAGETNSVVEQTQPGAVGLPASHLREGTDAILGVRGSERDVAADPGRQRWLQLGVWRVRHHLLPQHADGVPANCLPAWRIGHDAILIVGRRDTGRVALVGALDEQAGKIFWIQGPLVCRHRGPLLAQERANLTSS